MATPLLHFVLALTMLLGSLPAAAQQSQTLDFIVAVVDDNVITATQLRTATDAAIRQLQAQQTRVPDQNALVKQVLERLVMEQLQLQAAEQAGIQVDDQTVNAALTDIATRNNLTLEQLRRALEADGFSFVAFREEIRSDILSTRLRQRMVNSRVTVSEQEVDDFLASGGAADEREYHLLHILVALPEGASPDSIIQAQERASEILGRLRAGADFRQTAVATSDGLRALEGGDLGWLQAGQIPTAFASAIRNLGPGQLSDLIRSPSGFHILKVQAVRGDVQHVVSQTHARHILIQVNEVVTDEIAQGQLERLRERILAGEDFGELARANSKDATTAVEGGDLGWVSPGDYPPNFESVMDELVIGQVSEPFQSQYGWHVVQVIERRRYDDTGEYARTQARNALRQRKAEEEWELWLRRLRDEAYVEYRTQG